mmetsp:Transcript_5723/g.23172  ORF Transcript_5723/g.23172 Transcript_5723/m.23172 type:complete len:291 (-) Transcript_5723:378-1250(-)
MIPTSATSLSSISTQCSMPSSPFSAICGALFFAVLNDALPRPPRPPGITISRWPCANISASVSPVFASRITVPGGTFTTLSFPFWPCIFLPPPFPPGSARWCTFLRKPTSELMLSSASKKMAPPSPPLPPYGPPCATNASRRNATIPRPPSPALMKILAVSKHRISNGMPRSRVVPTSQSSSSVSPRSNSTAPVAWPSRYRLSNALSNASSSNDSSTGMSSSSHSSSFAASPSPKATKLLPSPSSKKDSSSSRTSRICAMRAVSAAALSLRKSASASAQLPDAATASFSP